MSFTIEEASLAGLVKKDNWRKYTKAMLRARAISALCRVAFADVLAGLRSFSPGCQQGYIFSSAVKSMGRAEESS